MERLEGTGYGRSSRGDIEPQDLPITGYPPLKKKSSRGSLMNYGAVEASPNSSTRTSEGSLLSPITPSKVFSPRNEIQQLATMLSGSSAGRTLEDDNIDNELMSALTIESSPSSRRAHRKSTSIDDAVVGSSRSSGGGRPRATSHDMGRRSNNSQRGKSSSFSEEGSSRKSRRGKLSKSVSETYRNSKNATSSPSSSSSLFEPQAIIREDHPEDHSRSSKKDSHRRLKSDRRKVHSLDDNDTSNFQPQMKQDQQQGKQDQAQQQQNPPRRTRTRRGRTTSDIRGFFPAKVQKYTVLPTDDEETGQGESWVQQQPPELASLLQKPTRNYHLKQIEVERYMSSLKHEIQTPRRCNDVPFALLFCAHFAVIAWLSSNFGINSILYYPTFESDISDVKVDYQNCIILTFFCGLFASGLSGMALLFMTMFPGKLMQTALILSVTMSFIWGTFGIGFLSKSFVPATGVVALMLTVGYSFVVWDRIPIASTNVFTALSLLQTKPGVYYPILAMNVLMLIWTLWWAFAFLGVYDWTQSCADCKQWFPLVTISLCFSYYWSYKVIVHVIQVMVAGVIGDAWFDNTPTTSTCCANIVRTSFFKASFFSFGSICFGSLIVGPLQVIHQILKSFIPHRSENVLLCLQECLLVINHGLQHCSNSIVHYVNPWAFTYVGLYGYSFLESGDKATTLFEARGWTKISNDALLTNVIFIFNIMIGGCTGVFAFVIEYFTDYNFTSFHRHSLVAFIVGFFIGLVSSGVLLSVVHSSVETIIVLYASSPLTLEMRYPTLSDTMHMAWKEVWPGFMNIDIFKRKMRR